jgi:hypothetical protein
MDAPCIRSAVCEIVKDREEQVQTALMVLSHLQLIANQATYNGLNKEEALYRITTILNSCNSSSK